MKNKTSPLKVVHSVNTKDTTNLDVLNSIFDAMTAIDQQLDHYFQSTDL